MDSTPSSDTDTLVCALCCLGRMGRGSPSPKGVAQTPDCIKASSQFDMNLFHVFIWVGIFRFSLYAVKKCSFMKCKKNDFIFSGFWKVVVGHSKEFFDK